MKQYLWEVLGGSALSAGKVDIAKSENKEGAVRIRSTLLTTAILVSLPLAGHADQQVAAQANWQRGNFQSYNNGDNHFRLRVALWGDSFYADDPVKKAAMIDSTVGSMNDHDLDFTIFVGDTKNGSTLCTDEAIGQEPMIIFNRLNVPTMYSLGDNEWTDCHRTNNGSYDPLERLAYLRTAFFNKSVTQGPNPIPVQRQGDLGQAYSENSRFVKNNVEFVALHIPGSNNNLVATTKQCTSKSNRTQADCDAATAEYQARNAKNLEWMEAAFAEAKVNHYAGIAIAIQADIYFPIELSDGGYQGSFLPSLNPAVNGYADFFHKLVEETRSYDGQVVLIHGDSHFFKMDKAMYNEDGTLTPNFTRIEVFGAEDNNWVEMTVDPTTEDVFSFRPVVVKK